MSAGALLPGSYEVAPAGFVICSCCGARIPLSEATGKRAEGTPVVRRGGVSQYDADDVLSEAFGLGLEAHGRLTGS